MSWFAVQEITSGVWLIAEPGHVNSWLVTGRDQAILIDTGLGIASIRPVAEALTPLPVSVLNTHSHFDHVGGNKEFSDITIHELGVGRLRAGIAPEKLAGYLAYTRELIQAAEAYRHLDQSFFYLIDDTSDPRPLPLDFDPTRWAIPPTEATATVVDGDDLDLGGRELHVLHTPGHSPDSVSLFDQRSGVLFAGDTINTGPIYAQLPDSNLDHFAHSARRLAELAGDVSMVCVSHFGRAVVQPSILHEVANAFAELENSPQPTKPARDAMNRPVRVARYPRFSILLPDPQNPSSI